VIDTSVEERYWPKVDVRFTDECWPWLASLNDKGYGQIMVGGGHGRPIHAHRIMYELIHGPIPDGLVIDHLCRNRWCQNPLHLEAVTNKENILRGNGWAGLHARKTHCPSGHAYEGENIIWWKGQRKCRTCTRAREREKRNGHEETRGA
jgi:hypothetical protein